jgi:hypothetical protein
MKNNLLLSIAYPAYFLMISGIYFLGEGMEVLFHPQPDTDETSYAESIEKWHQARIASLKAEDGWLNLAGLFWLKTGENSFGSSPDNDLVFPEGKIAPQAGKLLLHTGEVLAVINPNVAVLHENQPIQKLEIFSKQEDKPATLTSGPLKWFVIKRGERLAVRLRDLESPVLKEFQGIERFPVDTKWKVEARFEPGQPGKMIAITDVTGSTSHQPLAGTLVFEWEGKTHRLDATAGGDKLFIVFADATNGETTYGSGRFLYADKPGVDGRTILDFNKAINPPCAFTQFATCPLPPKQNTLNIAIESGEKSYGHH